MWEFHDALARSRKEASACRAKATALQRQLDRTDPTRFQDVVGSLASAQSRVTDLKARLACVTSEYQRRARVSRKAEAAAAERVAIAEARAAEAESRVEEVTQKLDRSEHYLREAEECAVAAAAAVQRARVGTHLRGRWHFDASDAEPSECGSNDMEMFSVTPCVFSERLRGEQLMRTHKDSDDDGVASVSMASRRGDKHRSTRQPHTVGSLDLGPWVDDERQRQRALRGGENRRERAEGEQGEQSDGRAETDAMYHSKDADALLTFPRNYSTKRQDVYDRGHAHASSTSVVAPLEKNEEAARRVDDAEREAIRLRISLDSATEEAAKAAEEAARDRKLAMLESERLLKELADTYKEMKVLRAALEDEKRRHEASRERVESRLEALTCSFEEESSCGAKAALVALLDEKSSSCFEQMSKRIRRDLENRLSEALRAAQKAEAHADFLRAKLDRQRLLCATEAGTPVDVVAVEDASEEHTTPLAVGVTSAAAAEGAAAAAEDGTGGCVEALRSGITQVDPDIPLSREEHGHSAQTRRAGGVGLHPSRRAQEGNQVYDDKSENAFSVETLESMPRNHRNITEKIPMISPPASIFEDFTSTSQSMGMYQGEATVMSPREECPRETLWGRGGGVGTQETASTDRRECHRLTETTLRHDNHVRKFGGVPVPGEGEGEGEMLGTYSVKRFGIQSEDRDEKSTKMEPITVEKMVEPKAVVTEPERHNTLLERHSTLWERQECTKTKQEVPRQFFAQERGEEEEKEKPPQESLMMVEADSSKLYRQKVAATTESTVEISPRGKHDAARFRPYPEWDMAGDEDERSMCISRHLQPDIFTIHAETETVPVSADMNPDAPEGSTQAPLPAAAAAAAVQEVMERHVKAKQGLREARACLLAPRREGEKIRRRELEASNVTGELEASKDTFLTEYRIAERERASKHAQREQELVDGANRALDEANDEVSRYGCRLGTTWAAKAIAIEDDDAAVPKRVVAVEANAEEAKGVNDGARGDIETRLEVSRRDIRHAEEANKVHVIDRASEDGAIKEKGISVYKTSRLECAIREGGTGEHENSRMMRAEAVECGDAMVESISVSADAARRMNGEGGVDGRSQLLLIPKEELREVEAYRAREVDVSEREEGRKLTREVDAEPMDDLKCLEEERNPIFLHAKAGSGELSKAFEEERGENMMQTALTALLGEKLKAEKRTAEAERELEAALAVARSAQSAAATYPRAELEVTKMDSATESMTPIDVKEKSDTDDSQAADRIAQLEAVLTAARNDLEAAQKEIETLRGELERAHAEKRSTVEASEADHQATREKLAGLESLVEKADREHALNREKAEENLQRLRSAVNEEGDLFKTSLAALLEEKMQAENSAAVNTRSTQLEEKSRAAVEGRRFAAGKTVAEITGRDPTPASVEDRGWNGGAAVQTTASPWEGRLQAAGWLSLEEEEEREMDSRVEVTRAAVMTSVASAIDDVTAARSKIVALQSAMEEAERECLESRERTKRRHDTLRQALEEEERENGVQAALTCLLYERDQAQARVDELEERLEEAHGTIRDGFAEVEASKPDYSRNRNTSLTTETRQSGAVPATINSGAKAENSSCLKVREERRNDARSLRTRYAGGEFGAAGPEPSPGRDCHGTVETTESPRGIVASRKVIGHAHHHDGRSSGFWSSLRFSGRETFKKAKERLRSRSPPSRG